MFLKPFFPSVSPTFFFFGVHLSVFSSFCPYFLSLSLTLPPFVSFSFSIYLYTVSLPLSFINLSVSLSNEACRAPTDPCLSINKLIFLFVGFFLTFSTFFFANIWLFYFIFRKLFKGRAMLFVIFHSIQKNPSCFFSFAFSVNLPPFYPFFLVPFCGLTAACGKKGARCFPKEKGILKNQCKKKYILLFRHYQLIITPPPSLMNSK